MTGVIAYHSYGRNRIYHLELTYSVLSAAKFLEEQPDDIKIVLVCDAQNQRPDLPVENVVISDQTMHEWQMNGRYNHAMQVFTPHHVLELYHSPTVLIDSDTFFTQHPRLLFDRIGPGRSLLNARERLFGESTEWQALKGKIEPLGSTLDGVRFSPEAVMYNAGIIGLHPADAELFTKMKSLTAALRGMSDIFTAVQVAASLVMDQNTQVSTCEDVLTHYWGVSRPYYHYQIDKLFPEIMKGEPIRWPMGALPKIRELPKAPFRHRLSSAVMRRLRSAPSEYGYAYQACRTATDLQRSDPALANVWAQVGVDMLIYGMPVRPVRWLAKDFPAFEPGRIADQAWMRPEVRNRWTRYWTGELGPATTT